MAATIQRLNFRDTSFSAELEKALAWDSISDQSVQESVSQILQDVRSRGDAAVLDWTNKLDGLNESSIQGLSLIHI